MIEILKFEMVNKGSLIARFHVKMHKWGGLIIKDCSMFESGDKKWINLPSRQYEADGKKKYAEYIQYEDRAMNDKFKASIMEAVQKYMDTISNVKPSSNDIGEFPF